MKNNLGFLILTFILIATAIISFAFAKGSGMIEEVKNDIANLEIPVPKVPRTVCYATYYIKKTGDCTFHIDSFTEGYWWETIDEAYKAGVDAIQLDRDLGYEVDGHLDIYECPCTMNIVKTTYE